MFLEDRDGVDPASFVDGDLVVAQPWMHLPGVVGVAVAADLSKLRPRYPLVAQYLREESGEADRVMLPVVADRPDGGAVTFDGGRELGPVSGVEL